MDSSLFVSDLYPEDMLYAVILRSPVASGRLVSVDCPDMPEGCLLVRGRDVPGENRLAGTAMPVLAEGTVCYAGEPAALLLGPDRGVLEDAAERCLIETEPETPDFSGGGEDAVAARREIRIGDPEGAFARAASVIRSRYATGIQEHGYAEPCGAVAFPEKPERPGESGGSGGEGTPEKNVIMSIVTATQWPFHVREAVAQVLGIPSESVAVRPSPSGVHLDGKIRYPSLLSCLAALGAFVSGKPVRLVPIRRDDFYFSPKRCASAFVIASALNEKGEVTGTSIDATVNTGAYGLDAHEILDQICLGSLGVYAGSANVRFSGAAFRTNVPPQGAFSGFGLAQGFFARERHVSLIADALGQDPARWRADNFSGTLFFQAGPPAEKRASGAALLDGVIGMSDFRRKWAAYDLLRRKRKEKTAGSGGFEDGGAGLRGIGIALAWQGNGVLHPESTFSSISALLEGSDSGAFGIEVILEKDGTLEIRAGTAADSGVSGGFSDAWKKMAREILGVEEGAVRIIRDTDAAPDSGPAVMSRGVSVLASLAEDAFLTIRRQRFRDPLPIRVVRKAEIGRDAAWDALFSLPGGVPPDCSGFVRPGWAAAVVETETDPVSCVPKVRGVWLAADGGRIVSEDRARACLRTATLHALGWAFQERISYTDGRIPPEDFAGFEPPAPGEMPPVEIAFIGRAGGAPDPQGDAPPPEPPRGIGDLPFSCVPAAFLQSVSQASGTHFANLPLTESEIRQARENEAGTGKHDGNGSAVNSSGGNVSSDNGANHDIAGNVDNGNTGNAGAVSIDINNGTGTNGSQAGEKGGGG